MTETVRESDRVGTLIRWAMLALGVMSPLSGLLAGYGVARGLSRFIYQLSVRVHDMTRKLDQTVASVTLPANGDVQHLDKQLQYVVQRAGKGGRGLSRRGANAPGRTTLRGWSVGRQRCP